MNHPKEESLALAASDDLSLWRGWRVRRHLTECADCREQVDAFHQMRVEFSGLETPEPPADLTADILRAARTAPERSTPRFIPIAAWASAAALAVLAVVALLPRAHVEAPPKIEVAYQPVVVSPTPRTPRDAAAHVGPAVELPKFSTVADAEADRDLRYLQAAAGPSLGSTLERWTAASRDHRAAGVLAGQRAEMVRSHGLPAHVELVAMPGSPIEIISAEASFAEGKLVDPVIEIRNTGSRPVKDYQLVWVVRDASGNEFRGRLLSAGARAQVLAPGARAKLSEDIVLEPEHRGAESAIAAARVFVRSTTFANDTVWVPERDALEAKHVGGFIPLTAKTMDVLAAYRSKGVDAARAQLVTKP